MTTQLNLLGTLPAKGVSPAALVSSETSSVLPQTGALPENGSFFSALMQMLFHQSVDPATIKKAMSKDPVTSPEEQAEALAPKDRVADIIRALTFLSREKTTMSAEQVQAAIEQCDAQLKLKLPGEPGALLSYLVAETDENTAGAVKKKALDGEPATDALMVTSEEGSNEPLPGTAVPPAPVTAELLSELKRPETVLQPVLPTAELSAEGRAPLFAVPAVPQPQNSTAAAPQTDPAQQSKETSQRRTFAVPTAVPQRPAAFTAEPPVKGGALLNEELPDPKTTIKDAPQRTPNQRPSAYPHSRTESSRTPVTRTPYSTTVMVPRVTMTAADVSAAHPVTTDVHPSPAVPGTAASITPSAPSSASAAAATTVSTAALFTATAANAQEPLPRTISVPAVPAGLAEQTTEQEQLPASPPQPMPEAAARSVMPQRHPRTEKTNEPQRPGTARQSFNTKLDEASAFLKQMMSEDNVTVVHSTAGSDPSGTAQQESQQRSPQTAPQNVPAENAAQRPAQQKEPSMPPVDRGAVGAPAPVESKTFAAPVSSVTPGPFDRTTVQSMLDQLSKGVTVAVNENHSEMKIVMHPESLGEVTVRVQVEEGKVSTSMDVQQTQVKQTIEANIPQLREALSAKGLTMDRIEVTTAQHGMTDESSRNRQGNDRKKGRHEFELVQDDDASVKHFGYNTVEYTI